MQKTIERSPNFEQWLPDAPQDISLQRGISSRRFLVELLVIVLLSAVAYISLAVFWIKFSRAEVFFAECAREMLTTNNFITPLYHSQPFFDKPIFVYWLIIAMFKTLGVSHLTARLPIIVASLLTISSTALAGAYLFGRRTGLLAALLLASSFMYLSFSTLCMSDTFLVLFDTLTLIAAYAGIISEKNRALNWWLASVSMGFAFLTKGPIGIVLPAVTIFGYILLCKKGHFIKASHIFRAIITIALVASPWFYAAYLANGPQSMVHFFIQENLQRFAGSTYDAHRPFWYTITSFFLGFAPWSIFLPMALYWYCNSVRQCGYKVAGAIKVSDDLNYANTEPKLDLPLFSKVITRLPLELSAELYLWIWVFVSVGFFCFSRGKCDYYTLPAFPAAALLLAHYVGNSLTKYSIGFKTVATTILISTILFSVIGLPQINKLIPIAKYVAIIKNAPKNVRVGIDVSAAAWIDEILFQSGKDAQRIEGSQQIDDFMRKSEPAILILPENKYNLLTAERKREYPIILTNIVSTHPITPGYLLEKQGNIADPMPFVVMTNIKELK
jgi:4-amino-4-deoxy-L-arabinose transferase-like glycosyltransferase